MIFRRDEVLNTVYSQSDFTLDEGERLLKGMQELREELNQYGEVVQSLAERAQDVVPLKQRRQPVTRPIPILAICSYKQNNVSITEQVCKHISRVRENIYSTSIYKSLLKSNGYLRSGPHLTLNTWSRGDSTVSCSPGSLLE